ncbi:MAG TPA: LuxR C-terminal-related transcriptional regulator [Tepidisphaeraceae bacterium]|jgi:FixJ family two-component response regulator
MSTDAAPVPTVFVVDDDPVAAAFAAGAAALAGLRSQQFAAGEALLAVVTPADRGCLVLDLRMDGMDGLQLQAELQDRGILLPVIMVSGKSDIPSAVLAMKQAAFDFFEKPVPIDVLAESIRRVVEWDCRQAARRADGDGVRQRHANLSPREKQVMDAVVAGLANKQIASKLELSEKTIEVHRGNVMRKMQVDSVAALVRAALVCDPATDIGRTE